jgi:N-methylhydantoinase A/oxoprolinase/acetone carboxylase beta subunit
MFTDLVACDDDGAIVRVKVATTPRAPEAGLLATLRQLLRDVDARAVS